MNDGVYIFVLGFSLGFTIAWLTAFKFLFIFKKQEVE